MSGLVTLERAAELIRSGESLLLAGDESLLSALPTGDWIGGTIPYFMAAEGGIQTAEKVFVTRLPRNSTATIRAYDVASLPNLAADHRGNGFTILLIPAFSGVHTEYAKNATHYHGIFDRPVVGWISGIALDDIGTVTPKVFDGRAGTGSVDHAVALHVGLPADTQVEVDIINLFEPGGGESISFLESSFQVTDALIDGKLTNLADYLTRKRISTTLPLVADYNGAAVNVSIRKVDCEAGTVDFYAPVFPAQIYRVAAPIGDYITGFAAAQRADMPEPLFCCNCILNYVYAGLEGRSTKPLIGPMTFGEIAYMVLNQTLVHLKIVATE